MPTSVEVLADLSQPDSLRIKARDALLQAGAKGIDSLVELGKKPGQAREEDNDNIRMHVAIALANVRADRPMPDALDVVRKKAAENLDLLTSWLDRKDADPALRYWAIRAISFAQAPESANTLKKVLDSKPDPSVRMSIARSLGAWEGEALVSSALPLLVGLLKETGAAARGAGIEGLRLTKRNEEDVVLPLFARAQADPDEAAWRAAAEALQHLTRMNFNQFLVKANQPAKERKDYFVERELDWKRPRQQKEGKE
jgi:HEAT repeat protein